MMSPPPQTTIRRQCIVMHVTAVNTGMAIPTWPGTPIAIGLIPRKRQGSCHRNPKRLSTNSIPESIRLWHYPVGLILGDAHEETPQAVKLDISARCATPRPGCWAVLQGDTELRQAGRMIPQDGTKSASAAGQSRGTTYRPLVLPDDFAARHTIRQGRRAILHGDMEVRQARRIIPRDDMDIRQGGWMILRDDRLSRRARRGVLHGAKSSVVPRNRLFQSYLRHLRRFFAVSNSIGFRRRRAMNDGSRAASSRR